MTAHRLVCIDFLIDRLIVDRQMATNLLKAPLQAGRVSYLTKYPFVDVSGIMATLQSLFRQALGLAETIRELTIALYHVSADGRFMLSQNPGNLSLCLYCFQKRLNLITFSLAKVGISHVLLRLDGQKALILMHRSHPAR